MIKLNDKPISTKSQEERSGLSSRPKKYGLRNEIKCHMVATASAFLSGAEKREGAAQGH
jgi:hypothetical protein